MRSRIGIVLLALLCVGLAIALFMIKNKANEQQKTDADRILTYSNNWVQTNGKLEEQKQVAAMFEKDLETQKKTYVDLTNNYSQMAANLSQAEASLKASQAEVARETAKITELENQNQVLDKQAGELSTSITNLTSQIADTQKRLAASEGDKAFLEKELKRLMTEKAALERQFNDLTVLRAQVSKLKEELSLARRIEWIRQGLFASSDQKGAQKLMQGISTSSAQARAQKPNYDLNVEVSADGSVKVIPAATNIAAPPK